MSHVKIEQVFSIPQITSIMESPSPDSLTSLTRLEIWSLLSAHPAPGRHVHHGKFHDRDHDLTGK